MSVPTTAAPPTAPQPRRSGPSMTPSRLRPLASAVSGVAVALAFPPFDLVWLMPMGIAGLMLTVRGLRGRAGFVHGLLFGLGFMLPLMRWITIIGPDAWVALGLLEALFYGLMAVAWAWLRPHRIWPLAFALTWVGAEWLRGVVPFGGMPWGRLAFGLVDTTLVRYGRVGGTALVSVVVVLVIAVVVDLVERRRALVRRDILIGIAAAAAVAVSMVLPVGAAGAIGSVQVAAVQGNVPGEGMDAFAERRAVLNNHSQATQDFAAEVAAGQRPAPDFVIWPENSTDIDPFGDSSAYDEIDTAVRAVGVPTLVGAVVFGPDDDHVQNMAIVWDPVTGPGQEYVKRHVVPFGEYIPLRGLLTKFISRLDQIPRDFARGTSSGVLDLGGVPIGDVICFEVAYDGLIRDVMNGGGQLLVVQTNNATYTGTGQLEQQFAISRYRAIETGRSVVIAATNGISGVVAPDGHVVVETGQRTRAVLDENVTLAAGRTWGVRFGFWVEAILSLLGLGLAGWAYLGVRRRAGKLAE
jgi:apolipoprotein N-acyltransferase